MSRRPLRALADAARVATALLGAALLAACASAGPSPGTGDIAFRLTWDGEADLDLYVVAPTGERIDFINRSVPSGGTLDIDCNVTLVEPQEAARKGVSAAGYRKVRCPRPIENVFWPHGRAPAGRYRVQVLLASAEGVRPGDGFRLDVLLGRRAHRSFAGSVSQLESEPLAVEIAFPVAK